MKSTSSDNNVDDPFNLARFVSVQRRSYVRALSEVTNGRKRSHWMWYVFPQMRGLGYSATSHLYGISGVAEARAYLAHDVLGPRLIAICEAALLVEDRSVTQIFGTPDDMKLRSCATLFAQISKPDSVFHAIIEKYFHGKSDDRTLRLLDEG